MDIWCLWHQICYVLKSKSLYFVVGCHLKDIQIVILFNPLINNTCLKFNQKMQMIIMILKKHRKQRFYVTFFNNGLTLLATNKWKHKTKGLQLKVQLLKIYIIRLFFSDFFKEKKESKTRYKFYATTCSILQNIYIYTNQNQSSWLILIHVRAWGWFSLQFSRVKDRLSLCKSSRKRTEHSKTATNTGPVDHAKDVQHLYGSQAGRHRGG
jgi:hypothetical protein